VGLGFEITPKTVVRPGFCIVLFDQSGITTPFTAPQFPFIQNVEQKTQDKTSGRHSSHLKAHRCRQSP
jgi:hypothetical protein